MKEDEENEQANLSARKQIWRQALSMCEDDKSAFKQELGVTQICHQTHDERSLIHSKHARILTF